MQLKKVLISVLALFVALSSALEEDVGYFWHITDIHLDPDYEEGAPVSKGCHHYVPHSPRAARDNPVDGDAEAPKWGIHGCDTPYYLLEKTVQFMVSEKEADFVLWTGDDLTHFDNTVSKTKALSTMKEVTDIIESAFSQTIVWPILGNHDTFPEGQLEIGPNWLLQNASNMWRMWLDEEQLHTFEYGGYYNATLAPGWLMIGLNSDWWYKHNKLVDPEKGDPNEEIAWLKDSLQRAKDQNLKVLVVGHIPIGGSESKASYEIFEHRALHIEPILMDYSDIIVGQIYGHLHADSIKLIRSPFPELKPVNAIYTAPSVDPTHNPGVRLFSYNKTTFKLLNYWQYYYPLNDTSSSEPEWTLLYSAKEDYELNDLSPKSWGEYYDRIRDNDRLFDNYYMHNKVNHVTSKCDWKCKHIQLCAISHTSWEGYFACVYLEPLPTESAQVKK